MQFAFFGSPWFAAIILDTLVANGFVPSLVICNPDRPAGRKKVLTAPAVKERIINYKSGIRDKITILQPERLNPSQFSILNSQFDFFLVATYAKIISEPIFTLPRLGTIVVHHSLLPRHRGPTPVQSTILSGDREAGTTLFLMDKKIDNGPILAQRSLLIDNRNYEELDKALAELSGKTLVEILPDFLAGKITPTPQDHTKATFTKKFSTQDACIDEKELSAAESGDKELAILIDRKIRALNPEPGTWTMKNGKRVKLLEAEIREGKLVLKKIQLEGKKPQTI
ncbi:MAG: methionyl-tRNA formyltransferase [Candidatus Liptonbacteria bacterium]|nr:methionyl-tRNA formyltransferase [Candidatus Liptonbacteria bacterium]